MLQAFCPKRKLDGLGLNFAIVKVWGQGEEGPPGMEKQRHRKNKLYQALWKIQTPQVQAVSAVSQTRIQQVTISRIQENFSLSLASLKRQKHYRKFIIPVDHQESSCIPMTCRRCHIGSIELAAGKRESHAINVNFHLIEMKNLAS